MAGAIIIVVVLLLFPVLVLLSGGDRRRPSSASRWTVDGEHRDEGSELARTPGLTPRPSADVPPGRVDAGARRSRRALRRRARRPRPAAARRPAVAGRSCARWPGRRSPPTASAASRRCVSSPTCWPRRASPSTIPRFLSFVPAAPTEASILFDLVVGASSIYGGSWLEGGGRGLRRERGVALDRRPGRPAGRRRAACSSAAARWATSAR